MGERRLQQRAQERARGGLALALVLVLVLVHGELALVQSRMVGALALELELAQAPVLMLLQGQWQGAWRGLDGKLRTHPWRSEPQRRA